MDFKAQIQRVYERGAKFSKPPDIYYIHPETGKEIKVNSAPWGFMGVFDDGRPMLCSGVAVKFQHVSPYLSPGDIKKAMT